MEEKQNSTQNEQSEKKDLLELGADISKNSQGNIYTLTIIGQVEVTKSVICSWIR